MKLMTAFLMQKDILRFSLKALIELWGAGTIHETDDYIIYFKENTPKEIERRVVKEYAEYYKEYMKKFIG